MLKLLPSLTRNLLVTGIVVLVSACSAEQSANHPTVDHAVMNSAEPAPTYSLNGSYDDNGVEPAPNNRNQNFGRRP
jgi:hypothetical protein